MQIGERIVSLIMVERVAQTQMQKLHAVFAMNGIQQRLRPILQQVCITLKSCIVILKIIQKILLAS